MDIFIESAQKINKIYERGLITWVINNKPELMRQIEAIQDHEDRQAQYQLFLLYKYARQEREAFMAVFNVTGTSSGTDFKNPEPGQHLALAKIVKLQKDKKGVFDQFNFFFEIVSGPSKGCTQWDTLTLNEASEDRVVNACVAFGLIALGTTGLIDLEVVHFQGKMCVIDVVADGQKTKLSFHGYYPVPPDLTVPQTAQPFAGIQADTAVPSAQANPVQVQPEQVNPVAAQQVVQPVVQQVVQPVVQPVVQTTVQPAVHQAAPVNQQQALPNVTDFNFPTVKQPGQ